jgi:uncharacterized membrane protein
MDSLYVLAWWAGLLLPGLVAFIWLKPYLVHLSDYGYAISKIVGLVSLCYIVWLLANLRILPFGSFGIWVILSLGILASAGWLYTQKKPLTSYFNRLIILEEGLFAISLVAWSLVRSLNPRAEGVEKLMDATILNGLLRTHYLPPADPWYAGSTINYYYFGHWIVACLSKLTHVPAEVAFNLGLAGVFALVVLLSFALVVALTGSRLAGLLSAFLLTLSGNLDPALNTIKHTKDYIFFSATRLDPFTINEFPLYSFVVADLHAHTLDLPVVVGIISLLYALCAAPKVTLPLLGGLALLLGATGPANSFDLVMYGGLIGLVLMFKTFSDKGLSWKSFSHAVLETLGVGVTGLLLFLPFYLHFHAPVGGLGIDLFKTPLSFILINFGVLLALCVPIIILLPKVYASWKGEAKAPVTVWFGAALVVFAVLLIIVPEFVYLKDIYSFQNPPFARANTIFKVYFQVWVLLAIAAGIGIGYLRHLHWPRPWADLFVTVAGILIGLSLVGTWSGFSTLNSIKPTTLDGYAYLKTENPDQLALINWINAHISGQPRLLEAAGESYTQRSKISAYTGLIVPIGWASHEWGWRYSATEWNTIANRMGDVETMYTTTNSTTLRQMVSDWHIQYIVASPVEWQQYNLTSFATIQSTYGQPLFSQGQYLLYKVQ